MDFQAIGRFDSALPSFLQVEIDQKLDPLFQLFQVVPLIVMASGDQVTQSHDQQIGAEARDRNQRRRIGESQRPLEFLPQSAGRLEVDSELGTTPQGVNQRIQVSARHRGAGLHVLREEGAVQDRFVPVPEWQFSIVQRVKDMQIYVNEFTREPRCCCI